MDEMKLIALYCYLCACYNTRLRWQVQRFSNNSQPAFTDVEVLTIYLFALIEEDKRQINQIHRFAVMYLRSCFPLLPSYKVYLHRLNRLPAVAGRAVQDRLPLLPGPGGYTADRFDADLCTMAYRDLLAQTGGQGGPQADRQGCLP